MSFNLRVGIVALPVWTNETDKTTVLVRVVMVESIMKLGHDRCCVGLSSGAGFNVAMSYEQTARDIGWGGG